MENRQQRLAALNGESRIFVCADCGKVKHVKDAEARVGRTANLVCRGCVRYDIFSYKMARMAAAILDEISGTPVPSRIDINVTLQGEVQSMDVDIDISFDDKEVTR